MGVHVRRGGFAPPPDDWGIVLNLLEKKHKNHSKVFDKFLFVRSIFCRVSRSQEASLCISEEGTASGTRASRGKKKKKPVNGGSDWRVIEIGGNLSASPV
jgi:hypothetical protein